MSSRSSDLLRIRPQGIAPETVPGMTGDEYFQNHTLRPILKLQNPLLLAAFRNYIQKHRSTFYELGTERKMRFIENAIQRDIKFRNSLKGMIIGQFTLDEYESYIRNSSALNKRMMNMVIERLKDQVQLLDAPSLVE